ncbi:hypothetical protein A9Q81_09930 [Gammaproteobacteria bacterium 42_54_T18]|nr:hypothetical protein A9Q81_09930 [Gammaproteobacteria bacterium 42_54_T18]
MTIREFTPADEPQIHRIYNASKLDELKDEGMRFTLIPLDEDQRRSRTLWESNIYVYEQDRILGYCALFNDEVRALFVAPDSRRLGIGKLLLEYMLDRIEGKGTLYAATSNSAAISLYEHYGFRVTDTLMTDYNGVPVSAHRMEKA